MAPVELDVYIHTITSGYAYAVITEVASATFRQGLKLLGITKHIKGVAKPCKDIYFLNLKIVPCQMFGIRLMLGVEINITDHRGVLDLGERYTKHLDLRIAGIYKVCYKPDSSRGNADAILGATTNPYVNIIGHPDDGSCPLIYEETAAAAKRRHTLLEINNNSLYTPTRKRTREDTLIILDLCHKQQIPVIANSDAHFISDIANLDHIQPFLEEADSPGRLVINHSLEQFREFITHSRTL